MKILCPVKRVVDPYAKVGPLADGSGLDTAGVKFDINPFDEIAVEEAVRMKQADPSVEIVVVSIGSAECEEQLRKALAMGAEEVGFWGEAQKFGGRAFFCRGQTGIGNLLQIAV